MSDINKIKNKYLTESKSLKNFTDNTTSKKDLNDLAKYVKKDLTKYANDFSYQVKTLNTIIGLLKDAEKSFEKQGFEPKVVTRQSNREANEFDITFILQIDSTKMKELVKNLKAIFPSVDVSSSPFKTFCEIYLKIDLNKL